jgi:choline/glycine/proline betaine transport protein
VGFSGSYVGLFIAKISKGRTIREFILAVLFIPALFNLCFLDDDLLVAI